jgi:hypothetical protein
MIPAPDSCSTDVAAYALGALEPAEAEAFDRHLQTCAVCPVELTAFRQVVDDLALTPPRLRASRGLKRRVMRAIADTPRVEPAARPEPSRWRLALPRPAFALPGGLALAAVIAVAVVLALPGGGSTRTVAAQVTGRGSASLRVSGGRATLVVHHFPVPPHGKIYEIWLKRGNTAPTRSALFSVTDGDVDVPGSVHGVSEVLVTPEPAGGSSRPTHWPVISAKL